MVTRKIWLPFKLKLHLLIQCKEIVQYTLYGALYICQCIYTLYNTNTCSDLSLLSRKC